MEITCLEHLPYSICLFQLYTSWYSRLTRTYEIWIGFGMSIQGVQTCGDYMFSGHTSCITLLNFFITECMYTLKTIITLPCTWPRSAIGSQSDCRSRGREFDPGPVPYFRGDWSWNIFYGHSPPSADSRRVGVSYKRKYVHKVLVNRFVKLSQEKTWLC